MRKNGLPFGDEKRVNHCDGSSLSALWAGANMFCNFCANHRSEGHVDGCPNKTNNKVLVQTWHRGYRAGVESAQILDTNETFQLGYTQAVRMKNGESLLD